MNRFVCALAVFFLFQLVQAQPITVTGKLPDFFAQHSFHIATKQDPLDVHILTTFKADSTGRFSVTIALDHPQPLVIFEEAFVFPHQSGYCEFWASPGTLSVAIEFYNQATFAGENASANNLLAAIRQAKTDAQQWTAEWEYQTARDRSATERYLARLDSMKQALQTHYQQDIAHQTLPELDQWVQNELNSVDLMLKAEFYYYKLAQMDDTWLSAAERSLAYQTLTQPLHAFSENALQSETFVQYLRMCMAMNTDSLFRYRQQYPEFRQLLKSAASGKTDLIEMTYAEDNVLSVWNIRCNLNWLTSYLPDKPRFYEYMLAEAIYQLGTRNEVRDEQKKMLSELKQRFPSSQYIAEATEALIRYSTVFEQSPEKTENEASAGKKARQTTPSTKKRKK